MGCTKRKSLWWAAGTIALNAMCAARRENAQISVTILLVIAATAIPAPPFQLRSAGARVLVEPTGEELTAVRRPGGLAFPVEPGDLIEEPDIVETWAELDRFYDRQGELWHRLDGPVLEVEVAGAWRPVAVTGRSPTELPLSFYTLLLATLVAWTVGFATYAFSDRGPAARMYAASAVAFSVAVWPAALYMTRPLAIEPELFRWLSTIDHVGGLFFAAGVLNMIAVYPVRILRFTWWLWGFAVAAAVLGHYQIGGKWLTGFYTANAVQFGMFVVFSIWQWRAAGRSPLELDVSSRAHLVRTALGEGLV